AGESRSPRFTYRSEKGAASTQSPQALQIGHLSTDLAKQHRFDCGNCDRKALRRSSGHKSDNVNEIRETTRYCRREIHQAAEVFPPPRPLSEAGICCSPN